MTLVNEEVVNTTRNVEMSGTNYNETNYKVSAKVRAQPDFNSNGFSFVVIMASFQVLFVVLFGIFGKYKDKEHEDQVPGLYSSKLIIKKSFKIIFKQLNSFFKVFMDVHTMMFIGFGFLMTFLKRYGYSSVGFNFLIASFVLQWALLVRGWIGNFNNGGFFTMNIQE
jgi:ammonium transporter Rh